MPGISKRKSTQNRLFQIWSSFQRYLPKDDQTLHKNKQFHFIKIFLGLPTTDEHLCRYNGNGHAIQDGRRSGHTLEIQLQFTHEVWLPYEHWWSQRGRKFLLIFRRLFKNLIKKICFEWLGGSVEKNNRYYWLFDPHPPFRNAFQNFENLKIKK